MENFSIWWEALSFSLKIYWLIAIPSTLFFLLQLLLTFLGGDVPDDTPDAEIQGDTGIAFQFFTLKNLVAFFAIFGWTGIACLDSGLSQSVSLLVAFCAGPVTMTLMASIFYFLGKANTDGTLRLKNAIGKSAEVYLTIEANRHSVGKVQVIIQGSLRTLEAITDDQADIPTGRIARVINIMDDSILVVTANR